MLKRDLYVQCEIVANDDLKRYYDVCYIPVRFAKAGKRVMIDGSDMTWRVVKAYSVETAERLDAFRQSWRRFVDALDEH